MRDNHVLEEFKNINKILVSKDNILVDSLNNLFLLRSPLQIINAIEAIEYFNLKNNILVLIYGASEINKIQMEQLIESARWKNIIHIENKSKSKYFQYINLIKKLKKNRYKYVFLGELGIIHKITIPNVIKEKVFLLDDGTATLEYYKKNIKTNKYNKYNFREIRFLFLGLKIKIRDKVNLFTYFDLKPVHGIEVIKNDLSYLKKTYIKNTKKDGDTIYFIGQQVEHLNIMTLDTYKTILSQLMNKFNKNIIYIPHRAEAEDFIASIASIDNPLLMVQKINQPIELYFLENKIYPLHVISYFSTALTTLGMIYEDTIINVIKMPEDTNNKHFFDFFLREYYASTDENKFITYDDLGIIKQ